MSVLYSHLFIGTNIQNAFVHWNTNFVFGRFVDCKVIVVFVIVSIFLNHDDSRAISTV